MDEDVRVGLEAVVGHLQLEGLDARLASDCAYLGIDQKAVFAQLLQEKASPEGDLHGVMLHVCVRTRDDLPPSFDDVVTGMGATRMEAVVQALLAWLHGDFAPLRAFLEGTEPPDVAIYGRGSAVDIPPWICYAGPYQTSGPDADSRALGDWLAGSPPLAALTPVLREHADPERFHWVKTFRCRDPDTGFDQADCWLDGQPFAPGFAVIQQMEWPELQGRNQFRQFVILFPERYFS